MESNEELRDKNELLGWDFLVLVNLIVRCDVVGEFFNFGRGL